MENAQNKILSEINELIAQIKEKSELLSAKYKEYIELTENHIATVVDAAETIICPEVDEPVEEPVAEVPVNNPVDEPVEEPVAEVSVNNMVDEPVEEPVAGIVEEYDDVTVRAVMDTVVAPEAVMDVMAERQAWRKDLPGAEVKGIRNAITLNDKILFINELFDKNPDTFNTTLDRLDGASSLEQAVDYITSNFPDWDMDSDTVYRFMMAVRRKIR